MKTLLEILTVKPRISLAIVALMIAYSIYLHSGEHGMAILIGFVIVQVLFFMSIKLLLVTIFYKQFFGRDFEGSYWTISIFMVTAFFLGEYIELFIEPNFQERMDFLASGPFGLWELAAVLLGFQLVAYLFFYFALKYFFSGRSKRKAQSDG